ncbi:MAG TPA: LamG-like jellyroll fold domain-containing protein [Verrucomicrobiae bacterium]
MAGGNAFMYARFGDANGDSVEADSFLGVNGDNWNYSTVELNQLAENHVVWTADGNTHIAKLYLNGVLLSTSYTFTNSPAVIGIMTNNWLGRSKFSGDPLATANYDEFRIYNGAISALQVAADYNQNNPDALASYGTVTSVALQFNSTNIPIGTAQTPHLWATASGLSSGPVDIYDDPAVAWTSSDTSVASVDAHGAVTGLAAGSAAIVGTYSSLSVTQAVTVYDLVPTLLHRYSFNETSGTTAHDSIDTSGNSDGTLFNNAVFDGNGQVSFDGVAGDYVQLPAHLLDATNITANAVTLVAWATISPSSGLWSYLFNFGNITENGSGANGISYIYATPNGDGSRVAIGGGSPGFQAEDGADASVNLLGQTNIQVVVVFNPNPLRKYLAMYTNGVLAASSTTTKPYSALDDEFSFLGRSTYSADPWFNGSIDEFRVYNGEMNKFQVGASYKAGASGTSFDVGTPVSFTLNPGITPIAFGVVRQIQAAMNFTSASNVLVNGDSALTFTSSNPDVATIDNAGNLTASKPGSTTITAVYAYVSGVTTYFTNTVALSIFKDYPATLMHRYSFTNDASDSVGGATWAGTLVGNATISGGQLVLPNSTGTGVAGDYLQLPAGILTNAVDGIGTNFNDPTVTIEAWATIAPAQDTWANLFDFGVQDAGVAAYDIHNCVNGNGGFTVTGISDSDNANLDTQYASIQPALSGMTNIHIVCVFDTPAGYISCYTNGVLMSIDSGVTISMAGVIGVLNKIGADNWPDPGMQGSVDEFRIYNGVLHPDEIKADYLAGPNSLPVASPLLNAVISGGNLVIIWPTNGTSAFTLQSSSALGGGASWTTAGGTRSVVGTNNQATVPISGSAQFFRLSQ